jgi:hypothetical protein
MAVMQVSALQMPSGNQAAGPYTELLIKRMAREPFVNLEPRQPPPPCNLAGCHANNSILFQTHKSLPRGEALMFVLPNEL